MNKNKCEHKKLNTLYAGGHYKAQCKNCLKHGLFKSFYKDKPFYKNLL